MAKKILLCHPIWFYSNALGCTLASKLLSALMLVQLFGMYLPLKGSNEQIHTLPHSLIKCISYTFAMSKAQTQKYTRQPHGKTYNICYKFDQCSRVRIRTSRTEGWDESWTGTPLTLTFIVSFCKFIAALYIFTSMSLQPAHGE